MKTINYTGLWIMVALCAFVGGLLLGPIVILNQRPNVNHLKRFDGNQKLYVSKNWSNEKWFCLLLQDSTYCFISPVTDKSPTSDTLMNGIAESVTPYWLSKDSAMLVAKRWDSNFNNYNNLTK